MTSVALITMAAVMVYALAYFSDIKTPLCQKDINDKKLTSPEYMKYAAALFAVFAVQLVMACVFEGHKNDIALFKLWTSFGDEHKVWEYYTTEHYVDYPPVYLYILFTMGKIASILGINKDEKIYLAVIKFVPILCDALTTIFVFKFAKNKIGEKKAFTLAWISALNPAFISNSTVWGQVDSFATLIVLALVFALYNKKTVAACAVFAVGFLTKPQMVIYAPLVGFTVLYDMIEDFKEQGAKALIKPALGLAALFAVLLTVPLLITGGDYSLLIKKLTEAVGKYPYATLNAPNFYGAFGLNWVKNDNTLLFLPIKTWGFVFIVSMSVLIGVVTFTVKDRKKIFHLSAFTTATIFMFAHTMHERYIYSALLILMVIFVFTKDKRTLICYFGFSLTLFISSMMAMITNREGTFIMKGGVMHAPFIIISIINLLIYALMVYSSFKILYKGNVKAAFSSDEKTAKGTLKRNVSKKRTFNLDFKNITVLKSEKPAPIIKKDILIMAIIMLVYGTSAFYMLGSNNEPETGYMPKEDTETVTLDMGSENTVRRIYMRSGWISRRKSDSDVKREIKFYTSSDGVSFNESKTTYELNKVFSWHFVEFNETARYIRLSFDEANFYLNEIAFFGKNETKKLPFTVISDNETAVNLADEQDKVKYEYSYYENTYFDEIYHPRTAYENITHRYPYENTHPPLGKAIIALGMLIFGVNPFGWRFFGTLFGVLMVPVSYIMGKKMFKSSFFATITCLLFSFDFMHLSQTRLATIDSFTAFFIMCSYLFMFIYTEKSFYDTKFKKTLVPLFLSGLFFGLSAATKWQGIYGGVGLAIIFAVYIVRRTLEFLNAKEAKIKTPEQRAIYEAYKPLCTKTICFAALFFVAIPAVIYFLAYIPAMNTPDTGIEFFFTNQSLMLNYHSHLNPSSVHPYSSKWWSWPLDMRPLYAYGPNRSFLSEEYTQIIASFGNPLVWWLTYPVIIGLIVYAFKKGCDNKLTVILAGFLSLFLPWAFISREAFIYHFFPCVIFVVLAIVYAFKLLYEKKKIKKWQIIAYTSAVIVLFAVFYPLLTGRVVPREYATALKWLESWPF